MRGFFLREEDTQTSAAPSEAAPSDAALLSAVQQLDAAFCRRIPGRRSSLNCFHRHASQRRRERQRFVAGTLQMHLNFERRLRRRGRVSALYPGNVSRSLRATLKRLFTADTSTSAPSCFMDPEIVEFVSRGSVSVAAPCR